MQHHHILKWVGIVSWVITALVAINVGLRPFGYNFFESDIAMNIGMSGLMGIHYLILASGVYSLVLFAMMCSGHCACGSDKNCK